MSVMSGWLPALFESAISVLIFCPLFLSVAERGLFEYPTIIADAAVSPCGSLSLCFMYFEALLLEESVQDCCVLSIKDSIIIIK